MLKLFFTGITMLAISSTAHSNLISSFNYYSLGGQSGPAYSFEDFEIWITDINSSYIYSRDYSLFNDFVFGVNDIGKTYVSNNSTDPGFNDSVNQLTNGIDNFMTIQTLHSTDESGGGSGGGSIKRESEWLFGAKGMGDLSGYNIDSIELTINDLAFYENYLLPYSSTPTNFASELDVTISIYGTVSNVPIPSSLILFLSGLIGITMRLRRCARTSKKQLAA